MHLVTNTHPINTGNLFGNLMPGSYVMHDRTAFELGVIADRKSIRMEHFDGFVGKRTLQRAHRILIMRSGAIGDLLFATPAIKAFRALHPDAEIAISCIESRAEIFENTGLFDTFEQYPLPQERIDSYDTLISLEDIIESETEIHAADAFAKALGVTITDRRPIFKLTKEEITYAKRHFNGDRPKVAIQLRAGVRNRDYPAHQWQPVLLGLEDAGWEVMLLGTRGQIPPMPPVLRKPYIREIYLKDLPLRETAAVIANCQLFIGPDSSLLHIAHALDIPAIGLFGPVLPKLRTSEGQNVAALIGKGSCAGCNWNYKMGQHFPINKPCYQQQICKVIEAISPDEILKNANLHF